MSQRIRRAQERNNLEGSTFQTGGHVAHHARASDPVVRVPQKTTGDVDGDKMGGLAKASPNFKPIEPAPAPKTKAEEKKAVAESTEKVIVDEQLEEKNKPTTK